MSPNDDFLTPATVPGGARYVSPMNPLERQHHYSSPPSEWRPQLQPQQHGGHHPQIPHHAQQQQFQLLQQQQLSQSGGNGVPGVIPLRTDNRLPSPYSNYTNTLPSPPQSQVQGQPNMQYPPHSQIPPSSSTQQSINYVGATQGDSPVENEFPSLSLGSADSRSQSGAGVSPLAGLGGAMNSKNAVGANSNNNSLFQSGNSSIGSRTGPDTATPSPTNTENPDPYGLLGLLQQLKTPSPTFKGTDLTSLGLNLSSSESLYSSFASPFSKAETEYKIPKCYHMMPKIPSPHDKMSLFSDETLFYIFYSMPGDQMQLSAAQELKAREWSYHTELQIWFQRLAGTTANKTQNFELGSYVYFDIKQWGKIRKANFKVEYMKLWS